MRGKEEAADYRYFPDPDLPPIVLSNEYIERIRSYVPELPQEKMKRFESEYGLSHYDATVLTSTKSTADYFEAALKSNATPKSVCNWIISELYALLNKDNRPLEECKVSAESLGSLVRLIEDGTISGKIGKQVLIALYENGGDPQSIVISQGLSQMSDSQELTTIIQGIIANHPNQFKEFVDGKDSLLGFFVGQVMKATEGKANPELVNKILISTKSDSTIE
jgi:aspartyl-tRNA(Asn)/glutamyl-tRNA(Gln) amidotransferase subunit B